jgi:hypothetical protein
MMSVRSKMHQRPSFSNVAFEVPGPWPIIDAQAVGQPCDRLTIADAIAFGGSSPRTLKALAAAMTNPSRTIAITINRAWREVYAFASRPENMALWASGLGHSLQQSGGEWTAEGPTGRVKVVFAPSNDFGVLDHRVITASGAEIYMPMRVIANGLGSELLLTFFRLPDMTDNQFDLDAEWISRDLQTLKMLIEA